MRLLEGQVTEQEDDEVADLRQQVKELQSDLAMARSETRAAQREAVRAVSALRKELSPLYRSLQAVFGEIDAVVGDEESASPSPRSSAVWENWKSKMRGQAAEIIDALLLHKEMTAQQIAIAIGIHKKNVPQLIFKLNKAGLINKNGDRFSLKTL